MILSAKFVYFEIIMYTVVQKIINFYEVIHVFVIIYEDLRKKS